IAEKWRDTTKLPKDMTVSYSCETDMTALGDHIVKATFSNPDPDNYNDPDTKTATLTISNKNQYQKDNLKFIATNATGEDGVFKATYKPGTNITIVLGGKLLDKDGNEVDETEVEVKREYTYQKKVDGEWVDATAADLKNAGEYRITAIVTTDDPTYDSVKMVALLTVDEAVVTSITATLEEGAKFTTANSLDDLKAKLKAVLAFDNDTKQDAKIEDLDITCNGLRENGKFKSGVQSISVKYTDEAGNEVSTYVNITVQKEKVALPVFKGGLSYTGATVTPAAENFNGYDEEIMTFIADKTVSGLNAGTYKAVFALNDPENYEWATTTTLKKSVFAVALYDEEITLLANEAAVDWNIAKAKISAKQTEEGALPVFTSDSFKGALASVVGLKYYKDEACTQEVAAADLAKETKYYVKAQLLDEENFELDASAAAFAMAPFSYTTPAGEPTVWDKIVSFLKTNWLWLVIAAVALILLILIIVLAVRASRKKRAKEELAEQRRLEKEERDREERKREQEERRREDREERMARMSQQQAPQPQYIPQPMPQMMPQMMGGQMPQMAQSMPVATGGGSSNEIAELKAEMAAMKAEQAAKEMAALRAEVAAKAITDQQIAQSRLETQFATMMARLGGEQTVQQAMPGGVTLQTLTELIRTEVNNALAGKVQPAAQPAEQKAADNSAAPAAAQVPPDAVMTTVTTTKIDTTKKPAQTAQAAAPVRTVVRNVVAPMPVDDGRVFDVGGFYKPADPITDMDFTDDENKE
ncbi:MAG: hypothetical protein K2G26_00795, partial [Clostridia bacterium]|nr:hypothetical protein [Clostridia bacterium]